jgi:hypothetical protein
VACNRSAMRSRAGRLPARLLPCMVSCVLAFQAPMNAPGARVRAPLPLTPASCKRVAVAGPSKDRRVGRLFMCSGAPDDMEGRGDLRGGKNKARNEQILALKKTFYSSPELSEEIPDSEKGGGRGHGARSIARAIASDLLLGIIRDMPLCRWDNVMLPGFNQVLNVWQVRTDTMMRACAHLAVTDAVILRAHTLNSPYTHTCSSPSSPSRSLGITCTSTPLAAQVSWCILSPPRAHLPLRARHTRGRTNAPAADVCPQSQRPFG